MCSKNRFAPTVLLVANLSLHHLYRARKYGFELPSPSPQVRAANGRNIGSARMYTQVTASVSENVCGRRVVSAYKYSRCLAGE